jgi:endogenous inhibitor of DNA gyrase (YacG/DUF329 family)
MSDGHGTPESSDGQSEVKKFPRCYLRGKVKRTCQECGRGFETYHSQPRKFCSSACMVAYRTRTGIGMKPRRGEVKVCPACGSEFYVSPANVDRRVFCSHPCATRTQANTVERPCEHCGRDMRGAASRIGRYCSHACAKEARLAANPRRVCLKCGKPINGDTQSKYCSTSCRFTGVEKPCEACGKPVYVQPHQTYKRFCSRACKIKGWKLKGPGYRSVRKDGYIHIYYPSHPDATKSGVILEHRLVAGQKYGRRILPTEHVHHINGDRSDNRPENLEIISPGDHARISNAVGVKKRLDALAELEEYRRRFGPLD